MRTSAVVMMAIAVAILFGTLSREWATSPLLRAAPAGFETCTAAVGPQGTLGEARCHTVDDSTLPPDLIALKWLALIGGFGSAVMSAFAGFQFAKEKAPPKRALLVFACTAGGMVAFEVRLLSSVSDLSLGFGVVAAVAGVLAAAIALKLLARRA